MFESDFLTMMPHAVAVARRTGLDRDRNPTYDTANEKTYRARITGKILALRRNEKEETTSVMDIYVHCGVNAIYVNDRVTLPDDPAWPDRFPVVFAVSRATDEDGHHHAKIQLGWMYHRQGQ